jgi:hypothetical protein
MKIFEESEEQTEDKRIAHRIATESGEKGSKQKITNQVSKR